jgi:hypothetical protein
LKQAGQARRKPRLRGAQLQQIEDASKRGPEAHGYASRLGTAGRVRELIEDLRLLNVILSGNPNILSEFASFKD